MVRWRSQLNIGELIKDTLRFGFGAGLMWYQVSQDDFNWADDWGIIAISLGLMGWITADKLFILLGLREPTQQESSSSQEQSSDPSSPQS